MKAYLSKSIQSARVRWLLEEIGAPYEEAGGLVGPLPALTDGELQLTEWTAILLHLADKHPHLGLAPPLGSDARACYYRIFPLVAAGVDPLLAQIQVRTLLLPEPTRVPLIDDATRTRLGEAARGLEEALGAGDFAVGEAFSAADVAAGSAAAWLAFFGILDAHPRLAALARRVAARPAYQRTHGVLVAGLGAAPRWELAYCLRPGAGGAPMFFAARPNQTVGNYADLVAHLDTPRPLWLLQFQYAEEPALGRPYAREEFVRWAETYLAAMRRIQPEGRLHVAGACEGTQIAVEIARLVEARGETLAFLGSFDTWPEENTRDPLLERVHQVEKVVRGVLARAPSQARSQLRRLVDRLAPDPRPAAPPPPPLPRIPRPEQVSVGDWAARAAPAGFAPEPIRSKITVFRSRTQPYWRIRDPLCGWASRTTGGVEVHEVEGHHDFVLREPHAPVLAEKLSACLRRLEAEEAQSPTRSA